MRKTGFSPTLAIAVLIIASIVLLWIAYSYPIHLNAVLHPFGCKIERR